MYVLKEFGCECCGTVFEDLVWKNELTETIPCPTCGETVFIVHRPVVTNQSQGRHSSVKCYDTEPIGGD